MVISSVFYDGTVNEVGWAKAIHRVGLSVYGVAGNTDLKVTAAAGVRTVSVAAGDAWGRGVHDTLSTPETVALSSVPTGTRWDLIVARRAWGTNTTVIGFVEGGSARALPARATNPGVLDEQPLALVRLEAGSTAILEVVDLRVIAAPGGLIANDDLVLQYMAMLGVRIRIQPWSYQRVINASGAGAWSKQRDDVLSSNSTTLLAAASGFQIISLAYRRQGPLGTLTFFVKRTGANLPAADADGDLANRLIGTLGVAARPVLTTGLAPASSGPNVAAYFTSAGQVNLAAGPPGWIWRTNEVLGLSATFIPTDSEGA